MLCVSYWENYVHAICFLGDIAAKSELYGYRILGRNSVDIITVKLSLRINLYTF